MTPINYVHIGWFQYWANKCVLPCARGLLNQTISRMPPQWTCKLLPLQLLFDSSKHDCFKCCCSLNFPTWIRCSVRSVVCSADSNHTDSILLRLSWRTADAPHSPLAQKDPCFFQEAPLNNQIDLFKLFFSPHLLWGSQDKLLTQQQIWPAQILQGFNTSSCWRGSPFLRRTRAATRSKNPTPVFFCRIS